MNQNDSITFTSFVITDELLFNVCVCVCVCVRARARARVYIYIYRKCGTKLG